MSKFETARAGVVRDDETETAIEAKIPDEAVNVLGQATKALKTLARRQGERRNSN